MTKKYHNEAERQAAIKKSKKEWYERKKKDPNFLPMRAERDRKRRAAKKAEIESLKSDIAQVINNYGSTTTTNYGSIHYGSVSKLRNANRVREYSEAPVEEERGGVALRNETTAKENDTFEAPVEEERGGVALRNETNAKETAAFEAPLEVAPPNIALRSPLRTSGYPNDNTEYRSPLGEEKENATPKIDSRSPLRFNGFRIDNSEWSEHTTKRSYQRGSSQSPRSPLRSNGYRNETFGWTDHAAQRSYQRRIPQSQAEDVIRHGRFVEQEKNKKHYVKEGVKVTVADNGPNRPLTVVTVMRTKRLKLDEIKNDFGQSPHEQSDMIMHERGRKATGRYLVELENENVELENDVVKLENDVDELEKELLFWKERCQNAEHENDYRHGHGRDYDRRSENSDCGRDSYGHSDRRCGNCYERYDENCDGYDSYDESYEKGDRKRGRSRTPRDSGYKRSKTFH